MIKETARSIKVFKETEILVVGGGPAGLAAAIAAARSGAEVTLVERYGHLGGMATGGLVILFDCLDDGKGNVVIKGLVEETIERLEKVQGLISPPEKLWGSTNKDHVQHWRRWGADGGEGKLVRYSPVVDPEMLKYVAIQMLEDSGVNILLHSWVSSAYLEGDDVAGVIFESKAGRMAIKANITIDCTGDGDVFATAGARFAMGRLPLGLIFRVGNIDIDKAEEYLNRDKKIREKIAQDIKSIGGVNGGYSFGELPAGFYMCSSHQNVVWFNTVVGGNALDVQDLTKVELDVRKAMVKTLNYFKKEVPGFADAFIIDTASQVGTRASRMLVGEHVLTIDELHSGKEFKDTVCVAQPPYKGFDPDDSYKNIPYRSFIPKDINKLLVAGRCFSGDLKAVEMLRVIPTVMLMGQACGSAAALAVDSAKDLRDISMPDLQNRLSEQGVYLP